jgi:hypothetical protein
MKKRIISIIFLINACVGMEKKEKRKSAICNRGPFLDKKDSKDSDESSAPLHYRMMMETSYANLKLERVGLEKSKTTQKYSSDFYKKILELFDGKDTHYDTLQQKHKNNDKKILGLIKVLYSEYQELTKQPKETGDLYVMARKAELQYYENYYFKLGFNDKERAHSALMSGDNEHTAFYKLLFFYKAQELITRSRSFFEKTLKIHNAEAQKELDVIPELDETPHSKAQKELDVIPELSELLTSKIHQAIDIASYESHLKTAQFKKETAAKKFEKIMKEKAALNTEEKTQEAKIKKRKNKLKKNERTQLKKFTQNLIKEATEKISMVNSVDDIKNLQEEIGLLNSWISKKRYKRMAENKYDIELKTKKTKFLEEVDALEDYHLQTARSFFDVFSVNPQKKHIDESADLLSAALQLAAEKKPIEIKDESCLILKEITYYVALINNPVPESLKTDEQQQ